MAGDRSVDFRGAGSLGDLLSRFGQLLLKAGDFGLDGLRLVVQPLHASALGLIYQFSELQLYAEGVIFESWIVHVRAVPTQPNSYAAGIALERGA